MSEHVLGTVPSTLTPPCLGVADELSETPMPMPMPTGTSYLETAAAWDDDASFHRRMGGPSGHKACVEADAQTQKMYGGIRVCTFCAHTDMRRARS